MSENMPVNVEIDNGIGSVTFADDVIAIIAGLAATEVKGVANMLGNMSSSITEMMGKKDHAKGVKVEVGTEEAAVDLYLVLNYGINIPDVCRAVQENVKKAIETMTGLRVVEVNVHVQGVKFEKEASAAPAVEAPVEAAETVEAPADAE